ncbi:MAG: NUDIX domain-containing protein [Pseudorhodobacter sp.]
MIRRFGNSPQKGQSYVRRAGVYAILPLNGGILTTWQARPIPEIQLPGGGIDTGEHPIAALHREVFEETGWHIRVRHRLGAFRRFTYMPEYDLWAEKLCTVYLADPTLRIGRPSEPDHQPLWLPCEVAQMKLGNIGDRTMLAAFLRGRQGVCRQGV